MDSPMQAISTMANVVEPSNASEYKETLALKKALEWELSLDTRDLRSHAWYHGPLHRQRAEEIVAREGEFLVRDCTSQPDNYVLTCHTKTSVLHFVINKVLIQPETVYEHVQYQFEEEAFDAIPDLITFYVGSGKPISAASGARIQYPCNRIYPLSFYGHKIMPNQLHMQMLSGGDVKALHSPKSSSGGGTLPHQHSLDKKTNSPPHLKRDNRLRSQSLTPLQAIAVSNIFNTDTYATVDKTVDTSNTCNGSVDELDENDCRDVRSVTFESNTSINHSSSTIVGSPIDAKFYAHMDQLATKIHGNGFQTIARCTLGDAVVGHVKFTTHSLPRPCTNSNLTRGSFRSSSLTRNSTLDASLKFDSMLETNKIEELPEKPPSPPPKPNRTVTMKPKDFKDNKVNHLQQQQQQQRINAAVMYNANSSDSGHGSEDSVLGDASDMISHRGGVIIGNPYFISNSNSSSTLKSFITFDAERVEEQLFMLELPEFKPTSRFDFENYNTLLLPLMDNQPLDGDALNTFKIMLLETGPKLIAEHITRIDINLLLDAPPSSSAENERNIFDCCGLEMITLPQGKTIRNDLIERTQCIKLMVAVTILTCKTDHDRAELLSKWIQIAVETKTALGNLFSFSAIMLGICMPQIQKLDNTWHVLRQKFTDNAFTFEAKLRPTLIQMNECCNPQAPNTTIPHILLYALLKDRPVLDLLSTNSNSNENNTLYSTCITAWESKADDFGMYINFLHLDSARGFLNNLVLYKKNARIILEDSNSRYDELLSDAFRTEFHVKFLWGSKGALATANERHSKLEKVLSLMADKFYHNEKHLTTQETV